MPQEEPNYSKRELDTFFREVRERFDDQDGVLSSILEQTKKTNGRVSSLENWKSIIVGASIVAWFGVIPLVMYIFINKTNHLSDALTSMRSTIIELETNK